MIRLIKKYPWILSAVIFMVLVILGSLAHTLWGDEAETAFYAKTILKTGLPSAFDGTNITSVASGVALNKNLLNHVNPWLPFYLVALSFSIFGESSFAARIPMIIISCATVPLIYYLTLEITKNKTTAFIASLLASLCVPLILFSFQARYYTLNVVFGLTMILSSIKIPQGKIKPRIFFIIAFSLYLYSHYVSGVILYSALFVSLVLSSYFRNRDLRKTFYLLSRYILLGFISFLLFLPWFILLNPLYSAVPPFISNFSAFLNSFPSWFKMGYRYFNSDNVFPNIFIVLLFIVVFIRLRAKKDITDIIFPALIIASYLLIVTVISAHMLTVNTFFTEIRYNLILIPLFLILCAILFSEIWKWNKYLALIIILLYLSTNIFTLVPFRSYIYKYVYEVVVNPYRDSNEQVAKYLESRAQNGDTIFINSDRAVEPVLFLTKKKLKVVNRVFPNNPNIFPEGYSILPKYTYSYFGKPTWIVLFSNHKRSMRYFDFDIKSIEDWLKGNIDLKKDYELTIIPVFYGSDATRPELEHHIFSEVKPKYDEQVFIYHLKKK